MVKAKHRVLQIVPSKKLRKKNAKKEEEYDTSDRVPDSTGHSISDCFVYLDGHV